MFSIWMIIQNFYGIFLLKKSQFYLTFPKLRAYIKTQYWTGVKKIKRDNGRVYDNGPFQSLYESNGIYFSFIFKPNQRYHGFLNHAIKFHLPCNLMSAFKDLICKLTMDDKYNALIKNKMWDLVLCKLMLILFNICGFVIHKE